MKKSALYNYRGHRRSRMHGYIQAITETERWLLLERQIESWRAGEQI